MFKRMKLAHQLNIAFGAILALLITLSIFAYVGLSGGFDNFASYRGLARDTNLAGRIQANLLMVRLNVLKYFSDNNPQVLREYHTRLAKTEEFLTIATKEIENPTRAQKIKESINLLASYKQAFAQVIDLISQRHKVVDAELNPNGLAMRKDFTEFLDDAKAKNYQEELYYIAKAQEALLLGRLYVSKFLVTNAEQDYQRALQELESNLPPYIAELANLVQGEHQQTLLAKYQQHKLAYVGALKNVFAIIQKRNDLIDNTLNRLGSQIADKLEDVKLSVKQEQDSLGPQAQYYAESMANIVAVVSLLSILLGGLLSWYLAKVIRRPIGGEPKEIAKITQKVSQGDLTIAFNNTEQATGIYRSTAQMTSSLRSVISSIANTGNAISGSADQVLTIAAKTTAASEEQRSKTATVATAVNEMSCSIQDVAKLAAESASAAEQAIVKAEQGKTTVDSSINAIESLAGQVEKAVKVIESLAANSHNIGSVVDVIQGISEQTNLLALNAAIEAARAGEHGRGFAVVADEVRGLAQRTSESTSEIQQMISRLQAGASEAVTVMKQSKTAADDTVQNSAATAQSLQSILQQISAINDMIIRLAASVEQQASVAEDINTNIAEISEAATESSTGARNTSTSAEDLTQNAQTLQNLVGQFRL